MGLGEVDCLSELGGHTKEGVPLGRQRAPDWGNRHRPRGRGAPTWTYRRRARHGERERRERRAAAAGRKAGSFREGGEGDPYHAGKPSYPITVARFDLARAQAHYNRQ